MGEDSLLKKVESTIHDFDMFPRDSRLVVGVSGGPDSCVLLHVLNCLRKKYNLFLWAAHLDHCLRGKEAKEDKDWVGLFARKLKIPVVFGVVNVPFLVKEGGSGLEATARQARYDFLEHVSSRVKANRIAMGHTSSDQAETILMRLIRGSGIDGLVGIPVVRGKIIRPLIRVFRKEVEDYCRMNNLAPRKDSSNKDTFFFRNRIRLELIPYLCDHHNPRVAETVCRTGELLRVDKDFLNKSTDKVRGKIVKKEKEGEIIVDASAFWKLHLSLQRRIVRQVLEKLKGNLEDIEHSHIDQILSLKGEEGTKLTCLPGKIEVLREYDELIFKKKEKKFLNFFSYVNVPGTTEVSEINMVFKAKVLFKPPERFSKNSWEAFFDLDEIHGPLYVRSRKRGDKFVPLGMKGKKKLKDFLIDLKVPRFKRDGVPILFNEEKILWVIGYRIDDRFKLKKETKKILNVRISSYAA